MVNSPFIVKVTSSRTLNVLISDSQSGPLNGMTSSAMDARVGLVRLNVMPLVALLVAGDVAGFSSRVMVSPLFPVMKIVSSSAPAL